MNLKVSWRMGLAAGVMAMAAAPLSAQMPKERPFSLRGVELGLTMDEFLNVPIPNDGNRHDSFQTRCSNEEGYKRNMLDSDEDQDDGIVECQWYSASKGRFSILSQLFVMIGSGYGPPVFQFIEQDGVLRLFRIKVYANNEYYPGIADALTRGYGVPKTTVEPFQTKAGQEFTSATSIWDNGLSTISLVQRCAHLERYCLNYQHSELMKPYRAIREKRAVEAASKL